MKNEKFFVMQIKESEIIKGIQSDFGEDLKKLILERVKKRLNDNINAEKIKFISFLIDNIELDIKNEISLKYCL